jgi:serine/threonine protein kinase
MYPSKAKFDNAEPKNFLNFNQVFKDVKLLGAGGFGETRLIVDRMSGKKYALKILKKFDKMDYYREINALIKLSASPNCNPNIVCYYDHFKLNKYYCILTEYIEGMTLRDFDLKYRLSANDVKYIGLWLLKVLNYLHSNGYAHNDISDNNIMVTHDKKLKLIDLGITCYDKANGYLKCDANRAVQLYYQSPELHTRYYVRNPKKYSKTSDVYATGVILYELFTGEQPYDRNKNGDIISPYHNIRNAPCINNVLKKMLTINPDQRINANQAYTLLKNC